MKSLTTRRQALLCIFVLAVPFFTTAQTQPERIAELIEQYREDDRGPYRGIFWFCDSGDLNAAREPCPYTSENNHQHADYKPEVKRLMREDHLFLGQILTNTSKTEFWDAENDHSQLKQYQLGNYLAAVDDGWVLEKAQFYRGAFQVEDEENWGREFFLWLLRKPDALRENYFLVLEAAKDIPHRGDTDLSQRIRAVSKNISDDYAKFMELRIKIHGQPEAKDAKAVAAFLEDNRAELERRKLAEPMRQLIDDIEEAYADQGLEDLSVLATDLSVSDPLRAPLLSLTTDLAPSENDDDYVDRITMAADLLLQVRQSLVDDGDRRPVDRLRLVDIANELGEVVFRGASNWEPATARERMEKICYLGEAAAGTGFIELWEFQEANTLIGDPNYRYLRPDMVTDYLDNARRMVEWGTATNRATYGDVVARYAEFEPLAMGFLDDVIRGSVLLPLGREVGLLGDWYYNNTESGNALLDLENQAQARGLNPGYARGKLRIVEGDPEAVEVNPNDIFVFARPPADLKPVGGILTVSEGNMVSHVQLLARNLGIPNAVLTDAQFAELKAYDGEQVFYAVSNAGTVLMKSADEMNDTERGLFSEKARSEERIRVPVDRLDLTTRSVLNMRQVSSEDSGIRTGPKAANLGQLKQLFPDKVVEGLVIPFGIFRQHLDQQMPGQPSGLSYWDFLNDRFARAKRMETDGRSAAEVETYTLEQLATLRQAIMQIEIMPSLVNELRQGFRDVLGGPLGTVPVFLRSDTNMEDLADFTGAGLNKTVFNVVDETKIMQGIREVWASPYTERSYRWRQRLLLNPENVFPSILIIPSVDVDYSGVMITKGVTTGNEDDVTVAFSRGAGGAVDGQAAEAYLLDRYGRFTLQAPARERLHRRLPVSGGSVMVPAAFDERVLSQQNLVDLYELAAEVERVMPQAPGVDTNGPFDVELGFQDDKIFLFQIRPFVENSRAQVSDYLQEISPARKEGVWIDIE